VRAAGRQLLGGEPRRDPEAGDRGDRLGARATAALLLPTEEDRL
jgi:hypothetical protein